jgi:hypothetical protein
LPEGYDTTIGEHGASRTASMEWLADQNKSS